MSSGLLEHKCRLLGSLFLHAIIVQLTCLTYLYVFNSEYDLNTFSKNTLPLPPISVHELSWKADKQLILNNISFKVEQGSFTGLIGPNGAGKSSLLRCLYRYIKPDSGNITFNEQNIWQMSANEYAQKVAVVLQESPALFNLSLFDVVNLGLVPHQSFFSSNSQAEQTKVLDAIEQVGLTHKLNDSFEHLSGGEKQRGLIARAIVQSPEILMMDEPTSHLDVKYQIQVMELAKSLGITVIASFHDLNLASALCDHLLVLQNGKLVLEGSPSEVINEKMLSDIYGICSHVSPHPEHHCPHITYHYGYIESATKDKESEHA